MFDGQWFPGQPIQFAGGFVAPPVSGGAGYSFNMTAGNAAGTVGYDVDGSEAGSPIGSINAEPVPGHALSYVLDFASDGATVVYFAGNATALLAGLKLYIDGVMIAFDTGGDWQLDGGNTYAYTAATGSPRFSNGVVYFIEIK